MRGRSHRAFASTRRRWMIAAVQLPPARASGRKLARSRRHEPGRPPDAACSAAKTSSPARVVPEPLAVCARRRSGQAGRTIGCNAERRRAGTFEGSRTTLRSLPVVVSSTPSSLVRLSRRLMRGVMPVSRRVPPSARWRWWAATRTPRQVQKGSIISAAKVTSPLSPQPK